ncbi:MAG TPA: hypothetical protein VHR88_03890 [Solirubrobacteraceae bacterium]|nr:hypothetical protein [Solirubrobacteraceae bacterium]
MAQAHHATVARDSFLKVADTTGFPTTPEALRESSLLSRWWYYGVELMPGLIAEGHYPGSLPMLPRLLLRRCDLGGMACLDMGCMEGLMPVLMTRGGAARVLAIDGVDHASRSSPR